MSFKDKLFSMLFPGSGSILAIMLVAFTLCGSAQITNGTVDPDEEKKKEKEPVAFSEDSLTGSNFYLTGLYQYSFRSLEDRSFDNYYKEWETQTATYKSGINLGLILELTDFLQLDIGLTYFGSGESYAYDDSLTDSTYAYTKTYRQVAIPVRLRYVYGSKFQVFGFAGIAPMNILKIRYESEYRTANGTPVTPDIDIRKDGFVVFNLMFTGGVGIQYNMKNVAFTLYPEYRRNLLNTYAENVISLNHHLYGIGVNAGFVFRF